MKTRHSHPASRRRGKAPARKRASYSRFSGKTQDDITISSQQSSCHEMAGRESMEIATELEFADYAISGTKLHRTGLDALLAAAERGEFDVLYFYSLSRLARESVIAMPILKRLVYVYRVRIVSVTEGIDSSHESWEMMAQIVCMHHERYVKDLGGNVFRGQMTNTGFEYSNGDYAFGFEGVPISGPEASGRNRRLRPKYYYAIDPEKANWVRRIFDWYVKERRSLRWIAKELNRCGVPKDHRATTPHWHPSYISRLLKNPKNIGIWPWGRMKNERDPETGLVFQTSRPAEESDRWLRRFPDLRLVDDEIFVAAQKLLEEIRAAHAHRHGDDGQFIGGGSGRASDHPAHLLSCLLICKDCENPLYVSGSGSKYLKCSGHLTCCCECRTRLPRDLAERLILDAISTRVCSNPKWINTVLEHMVQAVRSAQSTLPNELRETQASLSEVTRRISRLVDSVEGPDGGDPDITSRLRERRMEHDQLERKLADLQRRSSILPPTPTPAWVRDQMGNLAAMLTDGTPAAALALKSLVGGEIIVEELPRPGKKRRFWRGTFTLKSDRITTTIQADLDPESAPSDTAEETVVIDFIDINPLDAKAEEVKALYDRGMLGTEIAKELKCSRATVTKLLKHWTKMTGIELPDGYARRAALLRSPRRHEVIADEVHKLAEQSLSLREIARRLECDRNMVTRAYRHWYAERGLPCPDGRKRHADLQRQNAETANPGSIGSSVS